MGLIKKKTSRSETFDPIYVGQGVGIEFSVTVNSETGTYLIGKITDGNGKQKGTFELSDDRGKMYLTVNSIEDNKRATLSTLLHTIAQGFDEILEDQLTEESDETEETEE